MNKLNLLWIFVVFLFVVSAGDVLGAECLANLSNAPCTVTQNLTLIPNTYNIVSGGNFQGVINSSTSGITIDGNGSTIIGDNTGAFGWFYGSSKNVTIKNFNISNYTYGIAFASVRNYTIINNTFLYTTAGIRGNNIANSTIQNNKIFYNITTTGVTQTAGIYITRQINGTDLYNSFINNNISYYAGGIYCQYNCSYNYFNNNYLYQNTLHSIAISYDSDNNIISNNTILNGGSPTAFNGIRLTGSYNNISDNYIFNQTHIGIDLFYCESEVLGTSSIGNNIINNTIINMREGGHIQVCGSSNNFFNRNIISNFTDVLSLGEIVNAIYIRDNSNYNIFNNTIFSGFIKSDSIGFNGEANNNSFYSVDFSDVTIGRYNVNNYNSSNNSVSNIFGYYNYIFRFQHENNTVLNISSLNNYLAFYTNKSVISSTNINSNDGVLYLDVTSDSILNITVLDNYKLNESETRANNPISISGTSTSKTITSTLADTITTDVLIEPRDCNVGVITQTYPDGTQTTFTDYDCNNNIITLTSVSLPTGVSTLSISNCTGYERIWYPIITLMLVLSLLLFIYFFIIKDNENLLDGITVNKILILFISITLIIIFITVIADNMAGRCPV